MENINLCECLKDMPKGTKLYSTVHGKVSLLGITDTNEDYPIGIEYHNGYNSFTIDGKCLKYGEECVLFPSKEMRDWSKFFKHGDVVKSNNAIAVFDSWVDTTYTAFYVKYFKIVNGMRKDVQWNTKNYSKVSNDKRMDFIKEIENHYKGKLNLETLEIEHNKKDSDNHYTLKPFDKVLVRDDNLRNWELNLFSHYRFEESSPYQCLKGSWMQCIPYNEDTAHLLDTNKNYSKQ